MRIKCKNCGAVIEKELPAFYSLKWNGLENNEPVVDGTNIYRYVECPFCKCTRFEDIKGNDEE